MVMPDAYETQSDYMRIVDAWERAERSACDSRWRLRFYWLWPREQPPTLPLPSVLEEKGRAWVVDEPIAYPPKKFVLRAWHQAAADFHGKYDWVVKMDADAYLSTSKLMALLEHFDPAVPGYFGGAGYGRPQIRDGVPVRYCMGMGYVLSMQLVHRAFADESVVYQSDRFPNSDIAVARRIMDAAQLQCNQNGGEHMSPLFVNNYYGVRRGLLYPRYINAKGQIDTPMFDHPPHHLLNAILVHPIKNLDQRRAFERVLNEKVYPTLPFDVRAVVETGRDNAFEEARKYVTHYQTKVKGSCVANYAQQIVEYQHRLKSCEYTCRGQLLWQSAFIHSLDPSAARKRLEPLLAPLFPRTDFVLAVDGRALALPNTNLEPGEWGYRETMRGILTRLAQSGDTAWVVMDDDVLVHKNANEMLEAALHDTYCSDALCGGGALMLSASIWYNGTWPNLKGHYVGGWHLIDHDREAHQSQCASGHAGVLGSVAVAYTRPAARYILAWLDDPEKVHKPFDHVFADMASHGHPVRLLGEHVFAARLDTPSSTNAKRVYGDVYEVERKHRWEMIKYNHMGVYMFLFLTCTHATELYPMSAFLLRNTADTLVFRIISVFKRTLNESSISCSVDGVKGHVDKFHMFQQENWALERVPSLTHVQGSFDCEVYQMNLFHEPKRVKMKINAESFEIEYYAPRLKKTLSSGLVTDLKLNNKISFCIAPVFGELRLLHQWIQYHTNHFNSIITLYIFKKLSPEHYSYLNEFSNVRFVDWKIEDLNTGDMNYNPNLMQMNYSYYAQYSALADCILRSAGAKAIKISDMDEFLVKTNTDAEFSEQNHDRISRYHICATHCLEKTPIAFTDECNHASEIVGVESIINGHIASHQYPYYEAYRHHTPSPFATTSSFASFHFRYNNRVPGKCTKQLPNFAMFLNQVNVNPILLKPFGGRLGNNLFQWISSVGISKKYNMTLCINEKSTTLEKMFLNAPVNCSLEKTQTFARVSEARRYATYHNFILKRNTLLIGFLQSYKYFPPNVYDYLKFKDGIATVAKRELMEGKTNIGIHVRHEHAKQLNYLRFPPNDYFENVMNHFRREFTNAFFYVASDNTVWCKQQSFFQSNDVKIIEHDPSLDMAVLASCDHMILTIGTFGWWSAFLGAHKNGGKVIYYKEEFVMEHEINKGNVVKDDYYPKEWISNEQLIQKYTPCESTIVTAYFDIPSKHSKAEYVTWMGNMLSLQDAMVIFTSSDMVSTIMKFRSHAIDKTHVIVLDIHDIFGAKVKDELFWKHQLEMDPEKNIHKSYQLFWIWLSKSWFVTETIQKNPFNSEIFAWMDIGSFRTKEYNNKKLILHEELIPKTEMLIMATRAPTYSDNKFILKSKNVVWVAGAHMAGRSIIWKRFHAAFSTTMQGYITNNLFVGEDQAIIQSTCQNHFSLCNVVTPELVKGNKWFGLSYFLNVGTNNANDNDIPIMGSEQKCVFVTGMGHSGTSLLGGLLGARTDGDRTDKWHPSGLYEVRKFIDMNEKIMNHHKLDIRGTNYVNVIDESFLQSLNLNRFLTDIYKDPRLIFTWPYWKTACQSSGISPIAIFVYRNAACSCNHPNCPNCGGDCFGRHVNHLNNILRVEPDTYFFDIDKFFGSPWEYYTNFINMLQNQGVFVEKLNLEHFKSIYSQGAACETQLSIGSSFSFYGKTSVVTKQMFNIDWKITHCSNIQDTQTVVVTALWDIARETNGDGRKYSDYIQWFKKTLTLNSSIFIFSDKKTIEIVRGVREKLKLPTCYMTMDINDHPFYDLFFKENRRIVTSSDYISRVQDPGRVEVKNPYYNIIQWGKVELLKIALHDYNPFNSQYAVWIDAGISRFFPKDIPEKSFPSFNNPLLTNVKGLRISTRYRLYNLQNACSSEMEWKSRSYLIGGLLITEKSQVYNFSQLWKSHIGSMLREQKSANEQIALLSLWCKDPTQMSIVKTQGFWSPHITIQQSLFTNTRFEQISLPSVKRVCSNADFIPSQKISVWTMLTDGSDYVEGAFKLGASVQRFTSIALDLVVMELSSKPLSNSAWLRLRNAGWQKCVVDRIAPLDEKGTVDRFRDQFTKLHAWGMTMYDTLLYLDSDTLVLRPIDGLLQTDLGENQIGVARDYGAGKWRQTFNMGVFIIHPNTKEYERLLSLQKSGKIKFQTSMSEQGFLNVVYKNDWYDIGFEHNANLAIFSQNRSYWDKHERDIRIVHFTMNKPWKCSHEYSRPCSWWLNSI